jgi:hypothetical protein
MYRLLHQTSKCRDLAFCLCHNVSDPTIIFFDIDKMSGRRNANISPDRAVGDQDHIAAPDTLRSRRRRSSRAKRRQEEADIRDGTGTRPAAKVARLASAEEETKGQEGDETPVMPLPNTEQIMNLIKDLWSDDTCVIERALKQIADFGLRDTWPFENELKMRVLGVHSAVLQVLQKHAGYLEIQSQGIRALGNLANLMPTTKLLGDIGCVEFILARMEQHPDSVRVQERGCNAIGKLVDGTKDNAERVKKYGGIALLIAAMKAHPNREVLQYVGCFALENMSKWEEYRPLIVKAGGASAIAFAIEMIDNPQWCQYAYDAMRILVKE